jgi:voltage-gated potassium channel Kch
VLRRAGVTVFQGDARRVATLERLHSDRAVALVVAVGNPRVARLIAETASCRWPHLPVIIRARDSGRVQGQSRKVLAIPEPEAAAIALTAAGDVPADVANGRALLINDYAASPVQARPPSLVAVAECAA